MGCGHSVNEEVMRSKEISKQLKRDFSRDAQIVKLLLLGTGESGKSTIVKQMKLLHAVNQRSEAGFSATERAEAAAAIVDNVVDSMLALLEATEVFAVEEAREGEDDDEKLDEDKCKFLRYALSSVRGSRPPPPPDVTQALHDMWRHPTVRRCFARRNQFQLNDSAEYFLSDVRRFCCESFVPTDQDILRTRVRTTGIVRIEFEFGGKVFHMFDVGGQRSERKKWIHCFDNVTAVLFVISLSEFDQVLAEDGKTNRMQESLRLFGTVINSVYFRNKAIIVFFNKRDLFQSKLEALRSPTAAAAAVRRAFPEYRGSGTFDDTSDFIIQTYVNQSEVSPKHRSIYTHLTTATDTQLIERVFTNVAEIILQDILRQIGLH